MSAHWRLSLAEWLQQFWLLSLVVNQINTVLSACIMSRGGIHTVRFWKATFSLLWGSNKAAQLYAEVLLFRSTNKGIFTTVNQQEWSQKYLMPSLDQTILEGNVLTCKETTTKAWLCPQLDLLRSPLCWCSPSSFYVFHTLSHTHTHTPTHTHTHTHTHTPTLTHTHTASYKKDGLGAGEFDFSLP